MTNHHDRERAEKRAQERARSMRRKLKQGALTAGNELVKSSRRARLDVNKAGRVIEMGGRRIGDSTRRRLAGAHERLRARNRARAKQP